MNYIELTVLLGKALTASQQTDAARESFDAGRTPLHSFALEAEEAKACWAGLAGMVDNEWRRVGRLLAEAKMASAPSGGEAA